MGRWRAREGVPDEEVPDEERSGGVEREQMYKHGVGERSEMEMEMERGIGRWSGVWEFGGVRGVGERGLRDEWSQMKRGSPRWGGEGHGNWVGHGG